MIRLFGILTGSALAVMAMLVAFGVPELAGSDDAPVAASTTEAATPDVEAAVELRPRPDPLQQAAANDEIDITGSDLEAGEDMPIEPELPVEKLEPPVLAQAPEPAPTSQIEHWYAFWSPFRSEIAADGFIAELQRTTGLDYRVVKLEPGLYEVAFAYTDPTDRQDKLDRISAATGLDMSGG